MESPGYRDNGCAPPPHIDDEVQSVASDTEQWSPEAFTGCLLVLYKRCESYAEPCFTDAFCSGSTAWGSATMHQWC
jgi:hypothetical protein